MYRNHVELSIGEQVKAMVFDLDGTLTDTEKYFQRAWVDSVAHFGYNLQPDMALELRSLGRPFALRQFQEWYGKDFEFQKVRAFRKKRFDEIVEKSGIHLKPGAQELIAWLKVKQVAIALATSGETERARLYLEKTKIISYFDTIICSDMIEKGKPAPDTYTYACKELGLEPKNVVAVEDSPNGVLSAYTAGCHVIMVPDLTQPSAELIPKLYACVDSLEKIIQLFIN